MVPTVDKARTARDVADWCRRELDTAKKTGNLETRPFVQNAALIIEALDYLAIVEALREPEGAEVILLCDNPEFNNKPNNAIEIVDDWTQWTVRRFEGDTMLDCLRQALRARTEDEAVRKQERKDEGR